MNGSAYDEFSAKYFKVLTALKHETKNGDIFDFRDLANRG